MQRIFSILIIIALSGTALFGQATNLLAPGAPGHDAHWPTAAKQGFGSANSVRSKVWFTLADGGLSEVYYPTLDVPNVQTLQFVFASADGKRLETEADDTLHRIEVPDPRALIFRQVNTAKSGAYTISKTYVTDPERSTVLIDVGVQWNSPGWFGGSLYVYYDPSLNNSGMHDTGGRNGDWLVASDADKASALTSTSGLGDETNGYLGTSDGLTQLRRNGSLNPFVAAANGNVVQVARVSSGPLLTAGQFTLVLSFGRNPDEAIRNGKASLRKGFAATRREYELGWRAYNATLPSVELKYQRQFNMAAMVLKALEDKTHRGATIASPSIPWGGGPNANEPTISGYHAVWSRDLYQVATAWYAMGDRAAAGRALDYLFLIQQKADGSFPQNSWVDGRPIGVGRQMDQIGLPIVLAYQLGRTDRNTWLRHIKPAADFIIQHGPSTGQDRWEEKAGLSPATIAAEIAGLVCAAQLARVQGATASANTYLQKADEWAYNIDSWCATNSGRYGDGHYYLRIDENGNPNDGAKIEINSGGGSFDEREIVDAGFLELVRLGIKRADDPLIVKSLAVVDELAKVETPAGAAWYRYNHDAYGERPDRGSYDGRTGKGRLWPLLTGERGEYDLAKGDKARAVQRLNTMLAFANDGMMIPEQVWDEQRPSGFGWGTGSATPLAWSMAQFIRLAMNIKSGRNLETPQIVAARYLNR
ncbi:MAG: glucoamylase [Blastocatellia bacterium]|jgi:glucoamylase|nr:glucoamylase [Blastocatellia bacterium]